MDQAYQHLRNYKVRHASAGPQRLPDSNKVVAGIRAFYFKDPDGHNLELIYFPPGKGEPRWQKPGDKLFLGIDHTAIVVSDTERGLKFYRDLLQFKVAGASENFGIEQERLNNVFGARLRITGLKAPAGPGIEFLEYLAPRDGRPAPLDLRANDIAHWHTTLFVPSADSAANKMLAGKARFVSPGIIETPDKASSFRKAFLVRDHDGHGLQLVEK